MKHLTIGIFALLCINCYGQPYSKSWKDLNYAGDSFQYHRLDIYLPVIEKPTYPVVISIYGSAWFGNNLKGSDLATFGKALLDAGFAVVTPNHRSSMDAKFPAQIQDIKAVIRFIRTNAAKYQIDTSFIGINGFSSGGHLSALAGTSRFTKQFTVGSTTYDIEGNVGSDTTVSSSVHAVVDWSGPTDLLVLDSCRSTPLHDGANSPESLLIGGSVQDNQDKAMLANPITYIDANDPPFLILHGDADQTVPSCQSTLLFDALQKANVPSQLVLIPNAQHGTGMFSEKYFKMMIDFFTTISGMTAVDVKESKNSSKFSSFSNYPNPFNPSTTIEYSLKDDSIIEIKIFDNFGRLVRSLFKGQSTSGTHNLAWDGRDDNDKQLSSGLYYYQIKSETFSSANKMLLLK
ncbi:MAG TPA: prolyl oligopeptidase family serine peptidase [bacterium]|nr:prolyl oligopeptidase family serine peptidase [bacterium]HQJ66266.1 prolyl oligopeptidase family serine peptidase [bacterium]